MGGLYLIEVKKSASPSIGDAKNFNALDKLSAEKMPAELEAFKREIGMETVVCIADDTYPLSNSVRAFPSWAI